MLADNFATTSLPKPRQLDAWRGWYDTVFDVVPSLANDDGFVATNATWTARGFTLSRVTSPANTVSRTKSVIRRNPVDHWVVTASKRTPSDVATRGMSFEAPPRTPFILSFADDIGIRRREQDERVQLILARDDFQPIAPLLDAARGKALDNPAGRLLADY